MVAAQQPGQQGSAPATSCWRGRCRCVQRVVMASSRSAPAAAARRPPALSSAVSTRVLGPQGDDRRAAWTAGPLSLTACSSQVMLVEMVREVTRAIDSHSASTPVKFGPSS